MRGTVRFVVLIVGGFIGTSAALPQEYVSIPTTGRMDLPSTAKLGLPREALPALLRLQTAGNMKDGPFSTKGTSEVLSFDETGAIIKSTVPSEGEDRILLAPSLIERLRNRRPLDVDHLIEIGKKTGGLLRLQDTMQSVPPGWLPPTSDLPRTAVAEANSNGWSGPVVSTTPCAIAQKKFQSGAETSLQTDRALEGRVGNDRSDFVAAAEEFDRACLASLPSMPGASDPPLGQLAVLLDNRKSAVCMALHLWDDQFISARHCFFNAGDVIPQMKSASIQMLDHSDPNPVAVKLDPVASQPYPAPTAKIPSGQDIILFRAPALAAVVKARARFDAFAIDTTVAEEAYVVGVYILAKARLSTPSSIGVVGVAPLWTDALRTTKIDGTNYCRVWDHSRSADGGGCIEHSCQTLPGFSGAPVFIRAKGSAKWMVAGANVAGASDRAGCGRFTHVPSTGILGQVGALAAVIPRSIIAQSVAQIATLAGGTGL